MDEALLKGRRDLIIIGPPDLEELEELIGTSSTQKVIEYPPDFYAVQEKKRWSKILLQIGPYRFENVMKWLYSEPPEGLGMTTRDIASEVGVSHHTVERWLHKLNVKLRPAARPIVYPKLVTHKVATPLRKYSVRLDKALSYLMGFICGDGYPEIGTGKVRCFNKEFALKPFLKAIMGRFGEVAQDFLIVKKGGWPRTPKPEEKPNYWVLTVNNVRLARLFTHESITKILNDPTHAKFFIAGLWTQTGTNPSC